MVKVILRNYNKCRGKVLYEGYSKDGVKNFIYHYMTEKLQELGKLDEEYAFKDEDDFVDVELNNVNLICTIRGTGRWDISSALNYIDQKMK